MSFWNVPWLEVTILIPLIGAAIVSQTRDPFRDFRFGLIFTGLSFVCACVTWLGFDWHGLSGSGGPYGLQQRLLGYTFFGVDQLSAPLLALVALLHLLTSLATTRTKMRRFSFTWSLASESLHLAAFGTASDCPWVLVFLLAFDTIPPYLELRNRQRSTRIYVLHMALFVGLMTLGWAFVDLAGNIRAQTALATVPLLLAVLLRCGAAPVHCWVTDWLENASFGNALLFITPLAGVYAAIRLVLPIAPDWVLRSIGLVSLATAVYAAAMATVQRDTRRFFAFIFLSHASSVLIGLELHTAISLTGSLCLWISVALSLQGFGLVLRALESRYGRLSMDRYHGLYEHSPTLAVCFLLMGLGCVGFPGTFGYVATELLVDGAIDANLYVGVTVVVASALNGIAIVRAYFLIFTGTRHVSVVSMTITARERLAILTLVVLIIASGLFPQKIIDSRHRAAEAILKVREISVPEDEREPEFEPDDDEFV